MFMRRNKLFGISIAVLMLAISACGSKDLVVDTNKEELDKKNCRRSYYKQCYK